MPLLVKQIYFTPFQQLINVILVEMHIQAIGKLDSLEMQIKCEGNHFCQACHTEENTSLYYDNQCIY